MRSVAAWALATEVILIATASHAEDAVPAQLAPRNDEAPPAGYHEERTIRRGPFWSGVSLLAISYAVSVALASDYQFQQGSAWLVAPVVGPWAALTTPGAICGFQRIPIDCGGVGFAFPLLILDGVVQAAGASLITVGVLAKRRVWVRDHTALLAIPNATGSSAGLTLAGAF